ncbi:MAG: hypothetical protein MJ238_05480, partial [Bacilli bacterium]|nr:hypothetical protein [Bacilli bacterium]
FDKETNELVPLCSSVVTEQEEDPDPYEDAPFEVGTIIDMDARFITASYFQDGYATVSTLDENTGRANFGIVDTNGNYTVEPSYFDLSDEHHNGVVIATQRNGIQDELNSNSMNAPLNERDYFLQGPGSSSGFAFNRTQGFGNYGLVTVTGEVLLEMNNEYVQRIYEDTYFVRKNGREKYLFNATTKARTDIEFNVDYAYFAKDYALKRVKDQLYFTNLVDEIECEDGLNSYLDYFFFFWLDMKLPFSNLFSGYQDLISDFIRTGEYLKPCFVADNYLGIFVDRTTGKELPIPEGLIPKTDSATYDFIDSLVPAHYNGESVIYNIDDGSYIYIDVNKRGYQNVLLPTPDKWDSYSVVGDFLEFNGCYFNKNGNVVYTKGDEGITDLFKPRRNQTFSYDESVLEFIKEGDDPRDVYYYLDEHLLPHYVQIDEIGENSSKMLVSYAAKEAYVTEYNGTTPLYFPLEQNTPFIFYFSEIDTEPIQVIYEGNSLILDEDFEVTNLNGAQKLNVTKEFFDKYGLSTGTENETDIYNRYKAPVFEITLDVVCGSENTQVKIVRE